MCCWVPASAGMTLSPREPREKQSTPLQYVIPADAGIQGKAKHADAWGFTFGVVSLSYVYILANKRNGTFIWGLRPTLCNGYGSTRTIS